MPILTDQELRARIFESEPPLVTPCESAQIQPNGVDLTLAAVATWEGAGRLGRENAERFIPEANAVPFDDAGWVHLLPGGYLITFRETVHIPADVCALGRSRSSLLRMGASVATALWDSGYAGRSKALLDVRNAAGIYIREGARVIQLVFLRLGKEAGRLYNGQYQGER